MQNHLKNQTSPYLLQHVNNPVDWYPWGEEAFQKAKSEDKPIFLSIGYSTCHWCHVMAHESFEDTRIAEILNKYFVSIKVDKEERPDIDSVYMSVCQTMTGSGGWPTTIFLTPEQKPFYAGTYFPKTTKYGKIGLEQLLLAIHQMWTKERAGLLESAEEIVSVLEKRSTKGTGREKEDAADILHVAVEIFKGSFDAKYGGFGEAPKFPTPHNLLFLMKYYEMNQDKDALKMVEKTLLQMYRGGIFDHIGGGFSRYSTDRFFLVPHFEKMLYDNALLILSYSKAYQITQNPTYLAVAKKTAGFVIRELMDSEGGFYCAQDADSEGEEGKYYLLEPEEIINVLGEDVGEEFNRHFNITEQGNFEGKNIPNLLQNSLIAEWDSEQLEKVYQYRKKRYKLHVDDKILTSWNGLMIAAMCHLYRVSGEELYLSVAKQAQSFIQAKLCEKDTLYVSYRKGLRSKEGFLDDYANEILALLALYEATLEKTYLKKAEQFCEKVLGHFYDRQGGGFFLYGRGGEQLILQPKETYDGAMPSGNSVMAYNLVRLYWMTKEEKYQEAVRLQLAFITKEAEAYPAAYSLFLCALMEYEEMPDKITIAVKDRADLEGLSCRISLDTVVSVLEEATKEYPLKDERTTFYVCKGHNCYPPMNELPENL